MTMVPPESISKQEQYSNNNHHFCSVGYGYGVSGCCTTTCGTVMSRYDHEYYSSASAAPYDSYCSLGSDPQIHQMADHQDESRTNSDVNNEEGEEEEEAVGSSSASKDIITNINTVFTTSFTPITPPFTTNQDLEDEIRRSEDDEGTNWLQLSIGSHAQRAYPQREVDQMVERRRGGGRGRGGGGGGLVELDLLPGGGSSSHQGGIRPLLLSHRPSPSSIFHDQDQYFRTPPPPPPPPQLPSSSSLRRPMMMINTNLISSNPSLFFQQQQGSSSSSMFAHHNQDISWAFRPNLTLAGMGAGAGVGASSTSSVSTSSLLPYFAQPFQLQTGLVIDVSGDGGGGERAGPSNDFRLIDPPPRRPHSGIWFYLQASPNQTREPFLPQIPKNYLRIKDGRMTVRLLMKYLMNKLKLETESEIEIRCKGHQLQPFLTLQHVRDTIWSGRDCVTLLQDSSTTDHVMLLHYGRTSN